MRRLSESNRVVFVEVQEKYDNLRSEGRSRIACLKSFLAVDPLWIHRNLVVIKAPTMLPLHLPVVSSLVGTGVARSSVRISKALFERYIKHHLRAIGVQPTILWLHMPHDCLLAGKFGERMACLRTFDELSTFPSNATLASVWDDLERENIRKIDLVFASSMAQYEKRKPLNPRTYFVPNAVDFELFNKARTSTFDKPLDLEEVSDPVIGFMGTIDFRFDFPLVAKVAAAHPEWSVVLIGPARQNALNDLAQLAELPNVRWLGPKPRHDLPRYLKFLSVGTIPYLVTPATNTMYPWKLHEYLAAGLPVVATALDELGPFGSLIGLARGHEEFCEMLEAEMALDSAERASHRVEVAMENTWDRRVADMSALIDSFLVRGA